MFQVTTCSFTIPAKFEAKGTTFDFGTTKYHLLLATGAPNGVNPGYHGATKVPSASPLDLKDVGEVTGASAGWAVQVKTYDLDCRY